MIVKYVKFIYGILFVVHTGYMLFVVEIEEIIVVAKPQFKEINIIYYTI